MIYGSVHVFVSGPPSTCRYRSIDRVDKSKGKLEKHDKFVFGYGEQRETRDGPRSLIPCYLWQSTAGMHYYY